LLFYGNLEVRSDLRQDDEHRVDKRIAERS